MFLKAPAQRNSGKLSITPSAYYYTQISSDRNQATGTMGLPMVAQPMVMVRRWGWG